jgi:hypothetical protein
MKVIAAISFFVLLTFTQTPLGQLLKLPVLVEHYYKHKKVENVSLSQFLNDHYNTKHNDADQAEDDQLPFKTVLLQNMGFAIVPSILRTDFALNANVPVTTRLKNTYTPQQHLCCIFHPPRA